MTLGEYAKHRWLPQIKSTVKPRTYESYAETVRLHLQPTLGNIRIRHLTRGYIKALLVSKLTAGLARNSVRIVHAVLSALLNAAIDDEVLANPAARRGRSLRLAAVPSQRQEAVKAMTREQLRAFVPWLPKKPVRGGVALLDDHEMPKIPCLVAKVAGTPGTDRKGPKR